MSNELWAPSSQRIQDANLTRFAQAARDAWRADVGDQAALYRWSIEKPEEFWSTLWSFAEVVAERRGEVVLVDGEKMPGARWFPDASLNFAENLLRRRDDTDALVFWGEDRVRRRMNFAELYAQVSCTAQALRAAGVSSGDRVAAYVPNMPEAVVAMLASVSIGAVWSSCSPDFGVKGLVDRFGQIEPKVLFAADGYFYNGKHHDSLTRLQEIAQRIPSVERIVVIPYVQEAPDLSGLGNASSFAEFMQPFQSGDIEFEQLPFDHPLFVMYSSGTTGVPKCIVHGAGGTLLQHLKEQQLHVDLKRDDRLFFFTTCGWMMWNWLVSGLASGATLLLYDGSPFYPNGNVLFDMADEENADIFGTSAKFIDAIKKADLKPRESHSLANVRSVLSTGSPLAPESFDFVYEQIKKDVCLSSISGGTDIISCFALGNPTLPVHRGEIQCRGLGMRVEVFDDEGNAVQGEKGELVCTAPFPSMPVGFWNDADDAKYRAAYFEKFSDVWCHGDYVELTEHGGMIIYGRSDAVLNPGGVRIGTAEIYRQVEQLDEVVEGLVIGQEWDNDVRVVLFVRLQDGVAFGPELEDKIRKMVRANATPRHVPARIVPVTDIPRTKSGKIVELAVREVVHGRPVKNKEALANPEALAQFQGRAELSS